MRTYCIAQGTLLSALWWPKWEENPKKRIYVYTYSRFTLLQYFTTVLEYSRNRLELDMEQQTGSKLGKEYVKAVYCHLAYLTYMQSTSCKMPGWEKHKLESRLPGEISITSDMQKARRTRESLDEGERGE